MVTATASLVLLLALSAEGSADDDPARGQRIFESRCVACHSLDVNRVGPKLRGVYGRRAASVAGYDYSEALKGSGLVWNHANLDSWLAGPTEFIPRGKMGFRLREPQDRADVISYLELNDPTEFPNSQGEP